jgi:ankyrin repeat protein
LLLKQGDLDINAGNPAGMTLAMIASSDGHEDSVRLLTARNNVEINHQDSLGNTALMLTCRYDQEDTYSKIKYW